MKNQLFYLATLLIFVLAGCGTKQPSRQPEKKSMFVGAKGEVKLITLDPGHFHAALVQKSMYKQVDPDVHVYAPESKDVRDHLAKIEAYNTRPEEPASWQEIVYTGSDYMEKMMSEKSGNVVVLAGNNARKVQYILSSVEAGLNVLADKPMVITSDQFPMLEQAFAKAANTGVLLYDIMTERHEVNSILQKELSRIPGVFGKLEKGTAEEPAITKVSVHHFTKMVSGSPLIRPAWFFDTTQQGEGIVDVTTHLVDLVQWEAFPDTILKKEDVELISAKRWSTDLTPTMFSKATGLDHYPEFLKKNLEGDVLKVYSNGEINYTLRGIHARVSVTWNFEAPAGTGDTHYSIMRGSKSNLIIKQGEEENFKPVLYVEAVTDEGQDVFEKELSRALAQEVAAIYPGLSLVKKGDRLWSVEIPDKYKISHEEHFAQVMEKYLGYLVSGQMPEWEVPNMIVKYFTTTEALKMALQGN